jgi:hypothetical protein
MLKTTSQKRIVALTAQVASLEKGWQHIKKPKTKQPFVNNKKIPKNKGVPPKNRAKGKDWACALIGPTEGQPKWVQHSLHNCKIRQELKAKKKANGSKPAAQMKVTGMVAILPKDNEY